MKKSLPFVVALVILTSSPAFAHKVDDLRDANMRVNTNAQRIEQLLDGQGQPGDVVRSISNPDVVFLVMPSGAIERRNERYGTTKIRRPPSLGERPYNYRGR